MYNQPQLTPALSLKGIIDFTVPVGGSAGKAIHVKATNNISDLSDMGGYSSAESSANDQDYIPNNENKGNFSLYIPGDSD